MLECGTLIYFSWIISLFWLRECSTRKLQKMLYDNTNEIIPECIKLQMNCHQQRKHTRAPVCFQWNTSIFLLNHATLLWWLNRYLKTVVTADVWLLWLLMKKCRCKMEFSSFKPNSLSKSPVEQSRNSIECWIMFHTNSSLPSFVPSKVYAYT